MLYIRIMCALITRQIKVGLSRAAQGGDAGDVSPGPTSFDPGKGPIKKKKA